MAPEELTAHQIEQDRLDALEEARLLPIRKAQFEALQGFAQWLNEMHPSEAHLGLLILKMNPWGRGLNAPTINILRLLEKLPSLMKRGAARFGLCFGTCIKSANSPAPKTAKPLSDGRLCCVIGG